MAYFHVSAGWQTASGRGATWAGSLEAESIEAAMVKVESHLRSSRRVVRAFTMSASAYDAGYVPYLDL